MSSEQIKDSSGSPEESNKSTVNTTRKEALLAVQSGYSVIPLQPRGKVPPDGFSWKDYQHTAASEDTVKAWFDQWPNMNYGVVTGGVSRLAVLDVDGAKGEASLKRILEKAEELGYGDGVDYLEHHNEVTTGNGKHLYFREAALYEMANSVNEELGLDVRGQGGYVVGAGSIHQNGKRYDGTYEHRAGQRNRMNQPSPFPKWLWIEVKRKPSSEEKPASPDPTTGTSETVIREGARNSTLTKRAGAMHHKGLTSVEIQGALTSINTTQCEPPLLEREVRTIVESVTKYDRKTPTHTYNATPVSEWYNEKLPELEYIFAVPPVARGHLVMLAAPPKAGKSTFARAAAVAKAEGSEFLGASVQQGNVLYLATEENELDVKRSFKALGITEAGQDRLIVHHGSVGDYAEAMAGIRQDIEEKNIELIFIDTAMRLREKSFDTNDYSSGYDWADPLIELAHDLNITVVVLHHANKQGWYREGYEALRGVLGSTALVASVDSIISLLRSSEGTRSIQEVGRVGEDAEAIILHYSKDSQRLSHGGTKVEHDMYEKESEIMAYMEGRDEAFRGDIVESVGGNATVLGNALQHLVDIAELFKRKDGKKDLYSTFSVSEPTNEKSRKEESLPDRKPKEFDLFEEEKARASLGEEEIEQAREAGRRRAEQI